jgi:hypothetical protein
MLRSVRPHLTVGCQKLEIERCCPLPPGQINQINQINQIKQIKPINQIHQINQIKPIER